MGLRRDIDGDGVQYALRIGPLVAFLFLGRAGDGFVQAFWRPQSNRPRILLWRAWNAAAEVP